MKLSNITESTQKVAEAISAILHLDVTIVDADMKRVAATGYYKQEIGGYLPKNCYFEVIRNTKMPKFVDKPNLSDKCLDCATKGSCKELGSLGFPIIENDILLGMIGVLAFDEEQEKIIEENFDYLLEFLNKLSSLLISELNYRDIIKKLKFNQESSLFVKKVIY